MSSRVDVDSLNLDKEATPALHYATLGGQTLGRALLVPIAASANPRTRLGLNTSQSVSGTVVVL
jgi:hypothetical protein